MIGSAGKVTDGFGCSLTQLSVNQYLATADIAIFRKATNGARLDQVKTSASDRGFVLGVSAVAGHRRRIFHENHVTTHDFAENAIYIRDLAENYKADLNTPFDFLLFEISQASLIKFADEAELSGVTSLSAETASKDIVLANLARALMPALERPEEASALFVEQITTAIGTYLVQRYGGQENRRRCGSEHSRVHMRNWQKASFSTIWKATSRSRRWRRPATCHGAILSGRSVKRPE